MRYLRYTAITVLLAGLLVLPVAGGPARASGNILTQVNLTDGTNIGVWETDGGPALHNSTVLSEYQAIQSPVWEWGTYDCFTDAACGTDHHTGTLSKATFETTISNIANTQGRIPWIRLVPVSSGNIGGITGNVFCPPGNGSNWGMNLAMDKAEIQAISAVYTGPIVIEDDNEAEWDCYQAWGFSGGGAAGVSTDIAHMWSATMPQLKAYARSLGFSQVVSVGYIGVGGGPGWGNSCTVNAGSPYGYSCSEPNQWTDEFNSQILSDYQANGSNPDYIPDIESIHAYPHSADFAANPYSFDNNEAYAYYREWITNARSRVNNTWGSTIGNNIRFAISEWNAGICDSYPGNCWSGYGQAGVPGTFDDGFLSMLAGNGNTTGAGTAYWSAELFEVASNTETIPGPGYYNVINPDGTVPDWYANIKADFLAIQGQGNTVTVTNPGTQTSVTGTPVSLQMSATDSQQGQTFTWSATGLPPGLQIGSSTGLISGTPATAGTYNVAVTATDTTGAHGSVNFTWTVSGSTCTISESASAPAVKHSDYGVSSVTSDSFSPPANSLLEVIVNALQSSAGSNTVTVTDSRGDMYTAGPHVLGASAPNSAWFFQVYLTSAPGAMTVTAHQAGHMGTIQLAVRVLAGAAQSQSGAAAGTYDSGSTGYASQSHSITTTTAGSRVYAAAGNGNASDTMTAVSGTSSTDVWEDTALSGNTGAIGRSSSATGTPGPETLGWTATYQDPFIWAAQEILPASC